jgi:hypothetical protein
VTIKEVILDVKKIFPTHYPRLGSSVDLGRAKRLQDIDFTGALLEEVENGDLCAKDGHHRIGRAFELAPGAIIKVEVVKASEQAERDIYAARKTFERNEEMRNYDEFNQMAKRMRRE